MEKDNEVFAAGGIGRGSISTQAATAPAKMQATLLMCGDMLASAMSTMGWCLLGFLIIFVITAAAGSDGGTLSKDFPWQVRPVPS